MANLGQFLKEVKVEMAKVTWPTKHQTFWYTVIVIVMSAVFAAFLGLLDLGFQKILNKLLTQ
ncbi:MAG: preprotein translocase subunit SecE [Candidatus Yanofskybacteria bacterium RIFCSPHIGHO2_02_FULL_41_11]|uniref:Protein translocase subunit SecE n=1 Tax=Candidatus Yanofskybacteria bacterium RIFCSPHIGHO2_02_FULL_41_11 TaxID=1802675 RepID=A0A1F8F8H8_9BACT|nr:MAG: preprotein translocase subunit SecE [Candidatus Yanofskybacteria bacterium RIFCSPHIGHO2_02_FULL_41_11]